MLMCSAPVYHDVIDEWKHAGRPGRRKKKEKKLGELPSYMRGSDGPDKSRSEDLSGEQARHDQYRAAVGCLRNPRREYPSRDDSQLTFCAPQPTCPGKERYTEPQTGRQSGTAPGDCCLSSPPLGPSRDNRGVTCSQFSAQLLTSWDVQIPSGAAGFARITSSATFCQVLGKEAKG